MSATFYERSDFEAFLLFSVEANRAACHQGCSDIQAFITAQRNIALFRSIDGDHCGAVAVLEKLLPIAYTIGKWRPYLYYEYLNSLAVE